MSKVKDLTGHRFGKLTAIEYIGNNHHRKAMWICQCDCGRRTVVAGHKLTSGQTRSCGCLHYETARAIHTTHGKRYTRLYHLWGNMKQRCCNPSDRRYSQYGGRGITVCDEWLHDFQAFYDWAMASGYDENAAFGQCTLDRIDNDKGYYPDNCRWVNLTVQRNNRSDSRSKYNERN